MPIEFVLIPGLHGTAGLFRPLLKVLKASVFELPRIGPQDYETLSAWLSTQRFPISYVLVGESFGGPLALLHAARSPRGLKGVVLLGSFARMGMPFARSLSYLIPPLPLASALFRRISQGSLFSGEARPSQLAFFRRETASTSPWIFRARFQEIMRSDIRHALPSIKVPVLSVRATRDRMVPARAEDDLRALSDLRSVHIDSPHVIAGMRPRQLARELRLFRKSL